MAKAMPERARAVMTRGQLWTALEARYPKREYALLSEVRNSTGFGPRTRTADALALSLWPSRGLELHGFEIKAYRGDWKREKEAPEKAEEIARFCDYWWLVVTDVRIAPLDEVPIAWGVLGPNKDGSALAVIRHPTRLEALPWTRGFVASVLRNASNSMVSAEAVAQKVQDAHIKGVQLGESRSADHTELERLRRLEKDVLDFEHYSGIRIGTVYDWHIGQPKKFGEALKTLIQKGDALKSQLDTMERLADLSQRLADEARLQVASVRAVAAEVRAKASATA